MESQVEWQKLQQKQELLESKKLYPKWLKGYRHVLELLDGLPSNQSAISSASQNQRNLVKDQFTRVERMGIEMQEMGLPVANLPFKAIHIAGTKGKGSLTVYTTSLLNGLRESNDPRVTGPIGTFLSPHIVDPRERILINGEPLGKVEFTKLFGGFWEQISASITRRVTKYWENIAGRKGKRGVLYMLKNPLPADVPPRIVQGTQGQLERYLEGPISKPFYFMFMTMFAYYIFAEKKVEVAVVETGIGGRDDPTNILPPEKVVLSVVTKIDFDHMNILGSTLPEIAAEKAGIFKPGVPAITSAKANATMVGDRSIVDYLREYAENRGTHLMVARDIPNIPEPRIGALPYRKDGGSISLGGPFQANNRSLAVTVARHYLVSRNDTEEQRSRNMQDKLVDSSGTRLPISEDIKIPSKWASWLMRTSLRGRCEVFRRDPYIYLLDGAHTPESLKGAGSWFMQTIESDVFKRKFKRPRRNVLVFSQDDPNRDAAALLNHLAKSVKSHTTKKSGFFDALIIPASPERLSLEAKNKSMKFEKSHCRLKKEAEKLALARRVVLTHSVDQVKNALSDVRAQACLKEKRKDSVDMFVLVTGSLRLVGKFLRNEALDRKQKQMTPTLTEHLAQRKREMRWARKDRLWNALSKGTKIRRMLTFFKTTKLVPTKRKRVIIQMLEKLKLYLYLMHKYPPRRRKKAKMKKHADGFARFVLGKARVMNLGYSSPEHRAWQKRQRMARLEEEARRRRQIFESNEARRRRKLRNKELNMKIVRDAAERRVLRRTVHSLGVKVDAVTRETKNIGKTMRKMPLHLSPLPQGVQQQPQQHV